MSRHLIDFSRSFHAHTAKGEHTEFTVDALFSEMIWGSSYWATDEATAAAFRRIVKAHQEMKLQSRNVLGLESKDFTHLMNVVRDLRFSGPNAIGLSELRIGIAMSEIDDVKPEKKERKANNHAEADASEKSHVPEESDGP